MLVDTVFLVEDEAGIFSAITSTAMSIVNMVAALRNLWYWQELKSFLGLGHVYVV
jgi:hypothetical protein